MTGSGKRTGAAAPGRSLGPGRAIVPVARILALRSHSHGTAPRVPRRLHQYAPSELRGVMVEMQRVFSVIVPTPRDVIDFMLINVKAMYIEP